MTERSDTELEQLLRDGLQRRGDGVVTTAPVLDRVRADVRRHRSRRAWTTVVLAAASVAVVAAVPVALDVDPSAAPTSTDHPSPPTPEATTAPAGWRVERWAGAQVAVPPSWGWGSAPMGNGLTCGGPPEGPYVGRPILTSDVCIGATPPRSTTAPYVWLGEDLPAGTEDLGGGYVRETVAVAGTTVSVASDDAALRARIVASVEPNALCAASLPVVPRPRFQDTLEGPGQPVSATLCAYRALGTGDERTLVYGSTLDVAVARRTLDAVTRGPRLKDGCDIAPSEVVVVTLDSRDTNGNALLRRDADFSLDCDVVEVGTPQHGPVEGRPIREAMVPWATTPFRSILVGPQTSWASRYFIGILG